MPTAAPRIAVLLSAGLLAASPALAETPATSREQGPLCAASVLTALTAWDAGLTAAAKFGDKAVAVAREKGRDYLLPLLGIDPKATPPQGDGQHGGVGSIERLLEESRQDPARRQDLCIAITQAVEDAKGTAGAGLEALRRALDGLDLRNAPPAPRPAPGNDDGLIRT
ncbi:hypothetical protein [Azospirillum rugosum]|uniref:Uncharacterized protein n=1 Tax=Azospirillum rugosum TaxID=416170 RepID=A0ABS4SNH0_9PROT|nr:hypothetical protein [Azospirillum rugosum]MBP2294116.1 hypothetical protein [Azospirillum rugosum]MDQ0527495.1 hypothetical protein [Azospirillum rugosum]